MTDQEHPVVDDDYSRSEIEFVITDQYQQGENVWFVVTSMGIPLLEVHVREDVLISVEA